MKIYIKILALSAIIWTILAFIVAVVFISKDIANDLENIETLMKFIYLFSVWCFLMAIEFVMGFVLFAANAIKNKVQNCQ